MDFDLKATNTQNTNRSIQRRFLDWHEIGVEIVAEFSEQYVDVSTTE